MRSQNWDVSQKSDGFHLTADELADWWVEGTEWGEVGQHCWRQGWCGEVGWCKQDGERKVSGATLNMMGWRRSPNTLVCDVLGTSSYQPHLTSRYCVVATLLCAARDSYPCRTLSHDPPEPVCPGPCTPVYCATGCCSCRR